jgi:5-(carboxyamino)imidazole ribonucleotide mutase
MTVQDIIDKLEEQAEGETPEKTPDVGIVMGSDSDFGAMMGTGDPDDGVRPGAYDALTRLGFEEQTDYHDAPDASHTFETYVVSAHRTPDLMYAYGRTAADRGVDVIVAGAGGKSADLPNMTASVAYPVPVVGVPVQEKSVDSVVGMPQGAPLTAVDAGKSFNAALSASQFLSLRDPELADRLVEYHDDLRGGVADVSREMHDGGAEAFRERDG